MTAGGVLERALWLADLLVSAYTPPGGLLARRVDAREGRILNPGALVDELGDYAQYVWVLGRRTGRADLCAWALEQAHLAGRLHQRDCGLILRRPTAAGRAVEFFNALEIGDTLWGLTELAALSGDETVARIRDRLVEGIWRLGLTGGQVAYGVLFRGRSRLAALPITEPMTAGYVGESLVNMHLDGKHPLDLTRASALLLPWLRTPSFECHGLFTRWVTAPLPGLKAGLDLQFRLRGHHGLGICKLVKGDTYLAMALLALQRVSPEERIRQGLGRWFQALAGLRLPDGRFANYLDPATGRRWWVRLGENHSVIEALIDLHVDLGLEGALDWAAACAEAWLARRTPAGLVPEEDGSGRAFLDPQTDLSVDLFKLAELTGRAAYAEAAGRILEAVWSRHRLPRGLSQSADDRTPQPGEVETKFLGLALKGLLVRDAFERGERLLGESSLRRLCSDR